MPQPDQINRISPVARRLLRQGRSACGLLVMLFAGCGYIVGNGFQAEIRSVHVPIFTSPTTFRRGLEYQLTEAVQKQIQLRTPFRLVSEPDADTRLVGKIVDLRKNVLGETRFDDARELQLSLVVEVSWEDLRSGDILAQQTFRLSPGELQLISQAEYAPELGQSLATGYQTAVERLSRQIVDMMEAPW